MEEYSKRTVAALKLLLRERNLPVSGVKLILVRRLEDDDKKGPAIASASSIICEDAEDPEDPEDPGDPEDPEDLEYAGDADTENHSADESYDTDESYEIIEDEVICEGDAIEDDTVVKAGSNNEDLDDDEDAYSGHATDLSHSDIDEEGDNFTEILHQDGTIERIITPENAVPTGGEQRTKFEEAILNDSRFNKVGDRRKVRMGIAIIRAEANSKLKNQTMIDFSESASTRKFPARVVDFVPCLVGRYEPIFKRDGSIRKYRELSEEEINAEMEQSGMEQCSCVICTKRRENGGEGFTKGELRSGKKRGWAKYGPGRALGAEGHSNTV